MDKLAGKLRSDAEQIEVSITPQLDDRIRASLEGVTQDNSAAKIRRQPASFWWASSLTGVAATVAIVAIVNLTGPEPEVGITQPPPSLTANQFDWKLKPAVLTRTLEQELEDIQADFKKAEQAVRSDIEDVL
jgi:hypothetical protein